MSWTSRLSDGKISSAAVVSFKGYWNKFDSETRKYGVKAECLHSAALFFFPMQYNYPLIWSNPSARKKLLVRGNKFRTMYRPVKSEAFYQFFWREQRRTPFGVSLNTSIKQIGNAKRGYTKFSKRRWEKEEPETIQGKLGSRQLQRLMTTAWMKMLYSANSTGNRHISCKVSLWPQKTGREHNSRPTQYLRWHGVKRLWQPSYITQRLHPK